MLIAPEPGNSTTTWYGGLPAGGQEQVGHHPPAAVGRVERDLLAEAGRNRLLFLDLGVERRLVVRELSQVLREDSVRNRLLGEEVSVRPVDGALQPCDVWLLLESADAAEAVQGRAIESGLRVGVGEGVVGIAVTAAEDEAPEAAVARVPGPLPYVPREVVDTVTVHALRVAGYDRRVCGEVGHLDDARAGHGEGDAIPVKDRR